MALYSHFFEIELEEPEYCLIEVEVECDLNWENDGIGSYEYWGFNEYDKGHDYVVCENMEIVSKHSEEEMVVVRDYFDKNFEKIEADACEAYANYCADNYDEP